MKLLRRAVLFAMPLVLLFCATPAGASWQVGPGYTIYDSAPAACAAIRDKLQLEIGPAGVVTVSSITFVYLRPPSDFPAARCNIVADVRGMGKIPQIGYAFPLCKTPELQDLHSPSGCSRVPSGAAASAPTASSPVVQPPFKPKYIFRVAVRDGDSRDGQTIKNFGAALINDSGHIAFIATTENGPAVFLDQKVVADRSRELSGHALIDIALGQLSLNNASPPQVAYLATYKTKECKLCRRDGIAVNQELKLPFPTHLAGCGHGPLLKFTSPALNDSGSYVVYATSSDGVDCWVKDGRMIVVGRAQSPAGTQIGDFRVWFLWPPGGPNSLTNAGDFAFMASASASMPPRYLCTLRDCKPLPEGGQTPLMNNNRQIIYLGKHLMRSEDDFFFPSPALHNEFAMNDRGEIFDGHSVYNYADAMAPGSLPDVLKLLVVDPHDRTFTAGPPNRSLYEIMDGSASINNKGEIAFRIAYDETAPDGRRISHQAIVVGTPVSQNSP